MWLAAKTLAYFLLLLLLLLLDFIVDYFYEQNSVKNILFSHYGAVLRQFIFFVTYEWAQ